MGLKNWEDLRGKPVCGKQGAFYNQIVEERYGAKSSPLLATQQPNRHYATKALRGFTMTARLVRPQFSNWEEFEMPLNSEDDNPWALAVPSKRNCVFGRSMSGMQYQWHQDGSLIELEKVQHRHNISLITMSA